MNNGTNHAPGQPGLPPRWTSSRKEAVGTANHPCSRIWFTLSHGIINEIYYPRVDRPCTRDFELIVTDGRQFFSEEKRNANSKTSWVAPGIPAFEVVNSCHQGRYEIRKQILADPKRHVIFQRICFQPKDGTLDDYHLYALLAPHLQNFEMNNTAFLGEFKGMSMLLAEGNGTGLALACSAPWAKRSVGFVGCSDGWQDLHAHRKLEWEYDRAESGNIALTGEIDLSSCQGEFLLALGFGRNSTEAAHEARASLLHGFDAAWAEYRRQWENWQKSLRPLDVVHDGAPNIYRASMAVLKTHEATDFPGGTIASLSIPWGTIHGEDDPGGYHLVWPRDAYEACSAMLAAGAKGEARRALHYFEITQEADGHWPQNMWLDGSAYWKGIQIDETAAPILLLELARHEGLLETPADNERLWPMVRKAVCYIVQNGPATEQDRWEENPGLSLFTLATEIAALVVAADLATQHGETALGKFLQETADAWNDSLEDWTYASGTELARKFGVDGYYVRVAPTPLARLSSFKEQLVNIANRPPEESSIPASELVSPDALALVRFGLRAPDDPRILNTIKVIDALLKVDTPFGPAWHRYNRDGYGEQADGSPFDGTGIGRAWPLLTGERAHYELAAGHLEEARRLLSALEKFAGVTGLISEQVWDSADIPEKELFSGCPSGSARPLVWAHAEYVKLLRSLQDGHVFDQPPHTVRRYLEQKVQSARRIWRFGCQTRVLPQGRKLRIETKVPAQIRWTGNDWLNINDMETRDTGIGIHLADLPTENIPAGRQLVFTFYWPQAGHWEGRDFTVTVTGPKVPPPTKGTAAKRQEAPGQRPPRPKHSSRKERSKAVSSQH